MQMRHGQAGVGGMKVCPVYIRQSEFQAGSKQADLDVPMMLQQDTENRAAEPSWGKRGEPEEVLRMYPHSSATIRRSGFGPDQKNMQRD